MEIVLELDNSIFKPFTDTAVPNYR